MVLNIPSTIKETPTNIQRVVAAMNGSVNMIITSMIEMIASISVMSHPL